MADLPSLSSGYRALGGLQWTGQPPSQDLRRRFKKSHSILIKCLTCKTYIYILRYQHDINKYNKIYCNQYYHYISLYIILSCKPGSGHCHRHHHIDHIFLWPPSSATKQSRSWGIMGSGQWREQHSPRDAKRYTSSHHFLHIRTVRLEHLQRCDTGLC